MHASTAGFITQVIRSLPSISRKDMDFWSENQEELKRILVVLKHPKSISDARRSARSRISREYGKVNS